MNAADFHFLLWSYCTDLHQNFTRCRGISVVINPHIYKAMLHFLWKCQSKEWRRSVLTSAKKAPKLIGYHSNVFSTTNCNVHFKKYHCNYRVKTKILRDSVEFRRDELSDVNATYFWRRAWNELWMTGGRCLGCVDKDHQLQVCRWFYTHQTDPRWRTTTVRLTSMARRLRMIV